MTFYLSGHLRPIKPITVFAAEDVTAAFRLMQQGKHIGKIVVKLPDSTADITVMPRRRNLSLRSDRAYLFVGGLGGLGRSIATWLVEHGARQIIFMSRSAGEVPDDDPFVQELAAMDCLVLRVSGDVSKYDDVVRAIESTDWPIGGVLQASMVLQASCVDLIDFELC